jgi:hypothetical protein
MKKIVGAAVLALVAAPAAAAAGGSTLHGYGGSAGAVQGTVQKSGSLPFTGLSLTGVLIAGLVLVAVGVVIRRMGRASA